MALLWVDELLEDEVEDPDVLALEDADELDEFPIKVLSIELTADVMAFSPLKDATE